MVILGTKWPSMTSTCNQSAPAASTARASSPSRAKSAARMEGAMRGVRWAMGPAYRDAAATARCRGPSSLAEARDVEAVGAPRGVLRQDAQRPVRPDAGRRRAALTRRDRGERDAGGAAQEGRHLALALLGLQGADAIDQAPAGLRSASGGVQQFRLH